MSVDNSWIVSGSLVSWGDSVQGEFDLAVYLTVPREERFAHQIEIGGDMYEEHLKFLKWVAQYDEGCRGGRSKPKHEVWIQTLSCPVLRINGIVSIQEASKRIIEVDRGITSQPFFSF